MISDIVLDGKLPEKIANEVIAYVGVRRRAMERARYFHLLAGVGLSRLEILKDIDYLSSLAAAAPGGLEALTARLGVEVSDLEGKVRSVTYRPRRTRI